MYLSKMLLLSYCCFGLVGEVSCEVIILGSFFWSSFSIVIVTLLADVLDAEVAIDAAALLSSCTFFCFCLSSASSFSVGGTGVVRRGIKQHRH